MTKETIDLGHWTLDIGHLLVIGIWSLIIQHETDNSIGMSRIYAILSIAGWTWTVLFGTYLTIRLRQKRTDTTP